ncbi:MAG: response regulator transcription factor [Methanosarcinaceae archaeon]|nr:response regulator transcription factor [Methanosarcinaceae archaeon]
MKHEPTVFIIDDDPAVLKSLTLLLESVGIESKTYHRCSDFLAQYDTSMSGCLVVDIRMPEMSGLELQTELLQQQIDIPVIFISGHGDIPMAVEAMKKGAVDFLEKPFREQTLLDAINKGLLRDAHLRQRRERKLAFNELILTLTNRERGVMDLLIAGKTNKEIAQILSISVKTVDFHRINILEKMGVDSVLELVKQVSNHS